MLVVVLFLAVLDNDDLPEGAGGFFLDPFLQDFALHAEELVIP